MTKQLFAMCLFPLFLVAYGFGGTINVGPGDDLGGAIRSANSGDTVLLAAGTYTVGSPITIPSGVTVMGASPDSTEVDFKIAGGDNAAYGFAIAANAHDVAIEELGISSNHGLIAMELGSGYSNIVISHNNLQYGAGVLSDGTLIYGISGTISNDALQITHNYFHGSPGTVRNWCIYLAANSNFDYNQVYNVNDGGYLVYPGPNVSFSYNYGSHIHRMGQEVTLDTQSTFICTGNVFYDYVAPYFDTEGVSIVGDSGKVDITDNYFSANIAAGSKWGQPDGGGAQRFGYGIECTGQPCHVSGNTLVGTWAECVSSDIANAEVVGNNVYGSGLWGDFMGEPGPFGYGSVAASNNKIDTDISDAPSPPANTWAGPRNHSL
jgi:hypothetical protein